jgi:1A family penicillin-binding protein
VVLVGLFVGIFSLSAFLVWAATIEMPDFRLFEERKIAQSTKIYDRTGKELLFDVHRDIRRTIVPLSEISINIQNATIAIEDDRFYQHIGIEPTAILRAVLVNLGLWEGYSGQGGSTITQQVIKMALLTSEKTITRKVKEWILAIRLEQAMSKEQILALYLNEAPYGGNIYGVEEAAMAFFGKHAKDVTIAEAAYLAALPQAPTLYSPFGSNRALLEKRKNLILDRMMELGMITQDEYVAAKQDVVAFIPPTERGIRAPHFVMYVREQLARKYGEEVLNEGGLRVVTTLDLKLQEKAEELVKKHALENEKKYRASNAALVAINPKTGEILAMVGSRDYFDPKVDGNYNIATANRQPGSAFKPFVYAAGMEMGYTPQTRLFDVPTQFSTRCDAFGNPQGSATEKDCYMPRNYDERYRGPMTIKDALAQSVNVPAVKMLYLVGIDRALDFARRFGITTLVDKSRYGLTLVLGGGEVSLLELTSAYGVFATEGERFPYQSILRVEDHFGTVLEEYTPQGERIIDPEIARNISDILSDNVARTPAFGNRSFLYFPDRQVAVKTGTTNDYRDAWIIGYTPSLVVGAWAGNNDNSAMEKRVAGFIVAPLWNEFFLEAFKTIPNERFTPPSPISRSVKPALRGIWYGSDIYEVDRFSGKLATVYTPDEARQERVVLDPHEILHWVNKEDPTGPPPSNPEKDPQYFLWEIPAQLWILNNGVPPGVTGPRPVESDDVHTIEKLPSGFFISPTSTLSYRISEKISIEAFVRGVYPITGVEFFFNDQYIGSSSQPPYIISFSPEEYQAVPGMNSLKMVIRDVVMNRVEERMDILLLP